MLCHLFTARLASFSRSDQISVRKEHNKNKVSTTKLLACMQITPSLALVSSYNMPGK